MALALELNLTPAMKQYVEIKDKYPDCILLYRMGDFYEMFFEDAVTVAPLLEITLTSRNKGKEDSVPLCGFPYHAAPTYIAKLVEKGFKVAICEQVEDPKKAKGIVKREVIRVITPGLILEEENLAAGENNYLACLCAEKDLLGLAFLDISTGEFQVSEFSDRDSFLLAIVGLDFKELILARSFPDKILIKTLEMQMPAGRINYLEDNYFLAGEASAILKQNFTAEVLDAAKINKQPAAMIAAGAILRYVDQTQKIRPEHINEIKWYNPENYLILDEAARRNLEIFTTIQDNSKAGSLFSLINEALTPMGARRLRWWLNYPLVDVEKIRSRLAGVAEIKENHILRPNLRKSLSGIYDLERLSGRVALRVANPRDLIALKVSLSVIPELKSMLMDFNAPVISTLRTQLADMLCRCRSDFAGNYGRSAAKNTGWRFYCRRFR